jgi:hypothetical protein
MPATRHISAGVHRKARHQTPEVFVIPDSVCSLLGTSSVPGEARFLAWAKTGRADTEAMRFPGRE